MAAPTNITPETALTVTSLPYTVTLDVADQTNTLVMWWKYTAATEIVSGWLAFADTASLYDPVISVWTGDPSALVAYLGIAAITKPITVPTTPGTTYYFKVAQNGAGSPLGASIVFSGQTAPAATVAAGSLLVNDDTEDFPGVFLNPTTGAVLAYARLPAGERGVSLPTGAFALEDISTSPETVRVYTSSLILIASEAGTGGLNQITTDHASTFYIARDIGATVTLSTISDHGVLGSTWSLPTASLAQLAISRDRTTVYYGDSASSILRFNLTSSTPMTDFTTAIAGFVRLKDILVLADETVLAGYYKTTVTRASDVKRYSTAGAVTDTYTFGSGVQINRLALALNDPTSFWVWLYTSPTSKAVNRFQNIRVSDGAVLSTFDINSFETGASQVAFTDATPPRFGPSFSCPFLVFPAGVTSPTVATTFIEVTGPPPYPAPPPGSVNVRRDPLRRQRTAPHLTDGTNRNRLFYPGAQLLFEPGGPRDDVGPLYFDLEWSDNGGATWSNIHRISAGELGQYGWRAIWRRLGTGRDRVFRVTESNAAKIVWTDFLLDPDPESGIS